MRSTERVRRGARPLLGVIAALALVAGCSEGNSGSDDAADIGSAESQELSTTTIAPTAPFELTSAAFADGAPIPTEHVCAAQGGADVSPPLAWSGLPEGTTSVALVMDDPDAPVEGGFVHWVVVDLDPSTGGIDAGASAGRAGVNGAGAAAYLGPCPPAGPAHTYVFTLYAFAEAPDVPEQPTRQDVLAAAGAATNGAIGSATFTGTFENAG